MAWNEPKHVYGKRALNRRLRRTSRLRNKVSGRVKYDRDAEAGFGISNDQI
jgi:hypothetical protein